ncbi:translation initiation factor IF-5A [Candidatus Woesearchaeota archaeon]|nr:translation initiation factor IF-5A [Candidatus Woesearchaeota archaeon]
METKVTNAASLKVGGFVIFDGKACKITSIDISKTGKHGHAKARVTAVGLTDGSKIIKILPGHDKIDVPIIEKEMAQVLSITGSKANVMDMKTYETFDLEIPEDMKNDVKEGEQISYWIIIGQRVMRSNK